MTFDAHAFHACSLAAIFVAGAGLLAYAGARDIAVRSVPNWVSGAVALLGLVAQALGGTLLLGAGVAFLVFFVAALMWRRGWMGGADVKLYGASALLVPPDQVVAMLCAIAIAGGLIGLPYLAFRRRLRGPPGRRPSGLVARALRAERRRLGRGGPVPYAVAIACGALFVLAPLALPLALNSTPAGSPGIHSGG